MDVKDILAIVEAKELMVKGFKELDGTLQKLNLELEKTDDLSVEKLRQQLYVVNSSFLILSNIMVSLAENFDKLVLQANNSTFEGYQKMVDIIKDIMMSLDDRTHMIIKKVDDLSVRVTRIESLTKR